MDSHEDTTALVCHALVRRASMRKKSMRATQERGEGREARGENSKPGNAAMDQRRLGRTHKTEMGRGKSMCPCRGVALNSCPRPADVARRCTPRLGAIIVSCSDLLCLVVPCCDVGLVRPSELAHASNKRERTLKLPSRIERLTSSLLVTCYSP
jgi:hypothetical protein